ADLVSLHVPLLPATQHIIDAAALKAVRPQRAGRAGRAVRGHVREGYTVLADASSGPEAMNLPAVRARTSDCIKVQRYV
ncbi:hypothetical protein ACFWN1_19240, partial [Streptomyces sp. NPDC058459]